MSSSLPIHVVILAAGQGTRMRSHLPKVFHPLCGVPLIEHALTLAHNVGARDVTAVFSPSARSHALALKEQFQDITLTYQEEPLGTAHALLCAKDAWADADGIVLILFADTPLITAPTLQALVDSFQGNETQAVCVLALEAPRHPHYGRVILEEDGCHVARIVEMKNATKGEQDVALCNAGLMAVRMRDLKELLPRVTPNALTKEYYLTDLVELARESGKHVGYRTASPLEVMGINTRADLALSESILQTQLKAKAMEAGVTFLDQMSVYLSMDTVFGQDVTLHPHLYFGKGVTVEEGATILSFSHIAHTHIAKGATIGPFARLRPGTHVGEDAKVGNFVELKNTRLGKGTKVSHLTYLGDADVGQACNIGAGTITCNYDGVNKHKTTLEDGVFVGSNSTLIAPVTIGQGAYIGAGTVLTKDAPAASLTLSRAPLKEIPDGATRLVSRQKAKKAS